MNEVNECVLMDYNLDILVDFQKMHPVFNKSWMLESMESLEVISFSVNHEMSVPGPEQLQRLHRISLLL